VNPDLRFVKIFLSGGTGFIGSHLLRLALASGHRITALRRSPLTRPRIPLAMEPDWLEREMIEVGAEEFTGHDVLIHLATFGVSPQRGDWPTLFRVNVTETIEMCLHAAESGIRRFVICGSCAEYGKAGERYEYIPTDSPLEPISAYAASKAAATIAAMALARDRSLQLAVVRPFHLFGEGQHEGNFWSSLQRAALAGEDFSMTLGEQIRDYSPVREAASQILSAAAGTCYLPPGEPVIYNLGAGSPQTLRQFAEFWWAKWGAAGRLHFNLAYRRNEVMRYVPEVTNFEESLDWNTLVRRAAA
jgi:nucleoside-diphosphate-sugar epimerase